MKTITEKTKYGDIHMYVEEESSNIGGYGWAKVLFNNPENVDIGQGVLFVKFKKSGTYMYLDVAEEVLGRMIDAESKGKFFSMNIRSAKYKYKKIA